MDGMTKITHVLAKLNRNVKLINFRLKIL